MRIVLASVVLLSACASEPLHTRTMVNPQFAANAQTIATVDLAPVDLQLSIEPGAEGETGQVRSRAEATLANAAIDALDHRAYHVGTLLHRGGPASTADATLYIRGGSFVPVDRMPRANVFAERAAQNTVHATDVALDGIRVAQFCGDDLLCTMRMTEETCDHDEPIAPLNDNDLVGPAPDASMYVAMTLVDNRTGAVLWHSQADTAANAAHTREVAATAKQLIASLPAR